MRPPITKQKWDLWKTAGNKANGEEEYLKDFLAKITHIHKVGVTLVSALQIMPIGLRENIALIITGRLKICYLRKKAGLKQQSFPSWLNVELSCRSVPISMDNAPEVAQSIRRKRSRGRRCDSQRVGEGSRFWLIYKNHLIFSSNGSG